MTYTEHNRENVSAAQLVKGLIGDVSRLFRQEIQLAKTEAGERMESALHGGQMVLAGAIFAIAALGVFLAGLVVAVTAWLVSMNMDPLIANVIAAMGIAVIFGLIAWAMISSGINKLKTTNLRLERTANALSEDAAAIKERLP